jgi:Domain of unknown function (DUF4142)
LSPSQIGSDSPDNVFPGTFLLSEHLTGVNTNAQTLFDRPAAKSQEYLMLVRLSAAIAAICMLSGAALAQGAAKLTDPQIAHIAYTAGQLDIEAAKQALSKSANKDIRAFAEGMVRFTKSFVTKISVSGYGFGRLRL